MGVSRFILANTEQLHDKINQLATRVRQLEDALAHSHSMGSAMPHPLLSDDLLQIKRPLERERMDIAQAKEKKHDPSDTIDAMGSLLVISTLSRGIVLIIIYIVGQLLTEVALHFSARLRIHG